MKPFWKFMQSFDAETTRFFGLRSNANNKNSERNNTESWEKNTKHWEILTWILDMQRISHISFNLYLEFGIGNCIWKRLHFCCWIWKFRSFFLPFLCLFVLCVCVCVCVHAFPLHFSGVLYNVDCLNLQIEKGKSKDDDDENVISCYDNDHF